MVATITAEEFAERVKADILRDIADGVVLASVATFADLHDFVDANCYGGAEAMLEQMTANAVTDDDRTAALDQLCDLMNAAMLIVDEWLAGGRES